MNSASGNLPSAKAELMPLIAVVMGSDSDLITLQPAIELLEGFNLTVEVRILSAHRTPLEMVSFAQEARGNGFKVIIAGAGGAAHLPGMIASLTSIPVLGVPVESKKLKGLDSLLSIAQMPKGIPVGTFAIGKDGAINAALFAASIISTNDSKVKKKLNVWRNRQTRSVKKKPR